MTQPRTPPMGVWIVVGFFVAAILGPMMAPYAPTDMDLAHQFESPSGQHLLGTADNGVDILSALLHGARLSAWIALWVVLLSVCLGGLLGAIGGLSGNTFDHVIFASADLVQAFPAVVLNIGMLALLAEAGVRHMVFALVITGWVLYARLARAQTLSLREQDFVCAARALGASEQRIVLRHIVPNLAGPLVVQATSGMGGAILAESTLSFLGLGPGNAVSWGALLDQGSGVLLRFPHVAVFSGAAIAITVLGFNLAGDWLRDQLDPKT